MSTFLGLPRARRTPSTCTARAVPGRRAGRARRHPAAAQPRQRDRDDPGQAGAGRRRGAGLGGAARRRRGDQGRDAGAPRRAAGPARVRGHRARRARALGPGRAPRRTGSSPRSCSATGADEVVKVKSMATQEIGLNEALAGGRDRGLGDRPGRADRAARARHARRTSWCRRSTATGPRSGRSSCARWLGRAAGAGRPHRRAAGAGRGGPRRHLRRKFLTARVAISGANFAVAETGTLVGGGVRGQRADVPDPAADPDHRHGHREAGADLAATSRCSCSCCRARRPASG